MLQKPSVPPCYRMPALCGGIQNAKVKLYMGLANKRAATARDLRSKTRRFKSPSNQREGKEGELIACHCNRPRSFTTATGLDESFLLHSPIPLSAYA